MKTLLLIFSFSISSVAHACSCGPDERPLREKVKQYSFIAVVKVDGFEKVNESINGIHGEAVKLKFQFISLFKGDKNMVVYEGNVNTSCDNGIRFGGEWLLFASNSMDPKVVLTNLCGLSLQLRNTFGERTGYDAGKQIMDSLRYVLGFPPVKKENGRFREYFSDGKLSVNEKYHEGALTGYRKLYYRNGKPAQYEHYKNGKAEGIQRSYARSGQLLWERLIQDGELIKSIIWYDTSLNERRITFLSKQVFLSRTALDSFALANPMKVQIKNFYEFEPATQKSISRQFDWKGNLERTIAWNRTEGIRIYTDYFESGSVKSIETDDQINKTAERKEWSESGKLVSKKLWKNSKLIESKSFEE